MQTDTFINRDTFKRADMQTDHANRQTNKQTYLKIERHTNRHFYKQADIQKDIHTNTQTYKQKHIQTDTHTNRQHTDTHTDTN
jgi:hypothetical protein